MLTILIDIGHQRNLGIAFISVGLVDTDRIGPEDALSGLVAQSVQKIDQVLGDRHIVTIDLDQCCSVSVPVFLFEYPLVRERFITGVVVERRDA